MVVNDQRTSAGRRVAGVSTTMLMIATVVLPVALAAAAIAAWVIARQPPEQPLQVPSASRA